MKSKHLAILAAFVVALFATKLLVTRHDRQVANDLSDAGITRLLPESLKAADVRWVQVSAPGTTSDPSSLRVTRGSGDDWVVTSEQDAPADGAAVDAFVTSAVALSGEERGEGASHYAEYGLDEAHAVKVELGTTDAEKPAATLWLGKTGDSPSGHFVRVSGSERVSHTTEGLRASLGLWNDTATLDPDRWLRRDLLKVDGGSIRTISVDRPDVRYAFAQTAAAAPAAPTPSPEPGKEAPASAAPAKEWNVTAPTNLAWAVRKDSLSSTLGRVGTVRIDGIAPPDACDAAGPTSKVIVAEDGGASHQLTVGAKIKDTNDVALKLDGDPHCYRMTTYAAESLLPRAAGVYEVPAVWKDPPAATAVKTITYMRDGSTIRLTQPKDGEWTIESPETGKADAARVSRLVGAVTGLSIDDLASAASVPAALLKPAATVTVQAGGKSLTVALLGRRLGGVGEERYVRVQGGSPVPSGYVGVVSDSAAQSLLATLKELKAAT